jgi:hypothetical protein
MASAVNSSPDKTWPLGLPVNPSGSVYRYTHLISRTSPGDSAFIRAIEGKTTALTLFEPPLGSDGTKYVSSDIITGKFHDSFNSPDQTSSFASANVVKLSDDDYAQKTLTSEGYNGFVGDLFDQFGMTSLIITSLLAYGNTNNLSAIPHDLVSVWPHQSRSSIMLNISDSMTASVKESANAGELIVSEYLDIAEWRWIHPNRARCVTPTSPRLLGMTNSGVILPTAASYPVGFNKWDILRYEFYDSDVLLTAPARNDLILNSGGSNYTFFILYDAIAAPGSILLFLNNSFTYDDGSGSFTETGGNTSRVVIPKSYNINGVDFPTVIRIGFEWIPDFIKVASSCFPIVPGSPTPTQNILQYVGDIKSSLEDINTSYLGIKRLYMWRLVHDLTNVRIQNVNGLLSPLAGYDVPGIYMCTFSGATDYSSVTSSTVTIPQPQWGNFWNEAGDYNQNGTLLGCLNNVEILAYLTTTLSNEGFPQNKFGQLKIITDATGAPQQSITVDDFSYTDNTVGVTPIHTCYLDSDCWFKYDQPIPDTTSATTPPNHDETLYYIIAGVIILIIIAAIYAFFHVHKNTKNSDVIDKFIVQPPPIIDKKP